MRIVTQNIYKFEELPKKTQEKIIQSWRNEDCFYQGQEWNKTLKRFSDLFHVKVQDFDTGNHGYQFINFEIDTTFYETINRYEYEDNKGIMKGVRLYKYLKNNDFEHVVNWNNEKESIIDYEHRQKENNLFCANPVLTGVICDSYILEPLVNFLQKPNNELSYYDIMGACLNSWLEGFRQDLEYWYSEESILEDIKANDYEFTENGAIY